MVLLTTSTPEASAIALPNGVSPQRAVLAAGVEHTTTDAAQPGLREQLAANLHVAGIFGEGGGASSRLVALGRHEQRLRTGVQRIADELAALVGVVGIIFPHHLDDADDSLLVDREIEERAEHRAYGSEVLHRVVRQTLAHGGQEDETGLRAVV